MKKIAALITLFLIFSQPVIAGNSVLSKKEEVVVDKTQPFFINIYSKNDNDVDADFDSPVLANNRQIHFFNKPFENIYDNQEQENFFVSAKKTSEVDLFKSQVDSVEFMSSYKYGRWDLSGSIYQEAISGLNQYHNYVSFEPTYKLNDKISLFGGMSHSITDNHNQTSFGFKYTPLKFNRLAFKIGIVNYTKQYTNYRNRLKFETVFKI